MSEVTTPPREAWRELLLSVENEAWLIRALKIVDPKYLVQIFLRCFPPHHGDIVMLTGKRMKRVLAEDVLGRIDKIRERKPEVLERLVDFWLTIYADDDSETIDPGSLAIKAWLWTQVEEAPLPTWDMVRQIAESHTEMTHAATELESQLKVVQRELEWDEKAQLETKLAAEENKSYQLKELLENRTQDFRAKGNELASLKQELSVHQRQITQLQEVNNKLSAFHSQATKTNQQQRQELEIQISAAKRQQLELEKRNRELMKTLAEIKADRDDADRYAQELEQELEALEQKGRTANLPVDPLVLEGSLIIDYEVLGNTPKERLTVLLDLYEAALAKRPHESLESTNWSALDQGEFGGILLLGLELLLLDAIKLPVRRFLQTQSFSREALLHALLQKIESPRLNA